MSEQEPRRPKPERHLDGLLAFEKQPPRLKSFLENARDCFFGPRQPPLRVSAKPLARNEIGEGAFIYSPKTEDGAGGAATLAARFRPGERVDNEHLRRLARTGESIPWYRAFGANLRDYFFPARQAPLKLTSKPVETKSIWGFSAGHGRGAGLATFLLHTGTIAFAFLLGASRMESVEKKTAINLIEPAGLIPPYVPETKPKKKRMGGGGGGGEGSIQPPSKGKLPPRSLRQFVPPAAVVHNVAPKLVMQPTIIVPSNVPLPQVDTNVWGNPLAAAGPPSSGTGSGGGIGDGSGGGVGPGKGGGFGPGEDGGFGGRVFTIGGGVTRPTLLYQVEPEYSEEARKAKYQGKVVLTVVVDERGLPRNLKITHALGLGLDEKAIEAVKKWRFRPGYFNGEAVAVAATVEVNFRLL